MPPSLLYSKKALIKSLADEVPEGCHHYTLLAARRRFSPEEKVENEVAVMRFLVDQTSVSVPFVLQSGTKND